MPTYKLEIRVDRNGNVFLKNNTGEPLPCYVRIEGNDSFSHLPAIQPGQEVKALLMMPPSFEIGGWNE